MLPCFACFSFWYTPFVSTNPIHAMSAHMYIPTFTHLNLYPIMPVHQQKQQTTSQTHSRRRTLFAPSPFTLPSFRPSYCTLRSLSPALFSLYSSHLLPFIFTHSYIYATRRYKRHFEKRDPSSFLLTYVSLFFPYLFLVLTFDNLLPHAHANLDFDGRAQKAMSTLSCNC